jgi:hypothetical protein
MADVTDTYYPGEAFIGYGAQILVGQGDLTPGPETFVAVPDIESITPGDMTTGVIQKTHLRSPGRHHEKLATLRDSGPIALAGNYRPAHGAHRQAAADGFLVGYSLLSLWRNVTETNFKLVLPEEAGLVGTPAAAIELPLRGVVTKYQIGVLGLDGKCPFTCEITPLEDYSDTFGIIPATGATAGTPGTFTPTGASAPENLAAMSGITASPATVWTTGQSVVLGDASHAHWNGTAWVAGVKP